MTIVRAVEITLLHHCCTSDLDVGLGHDDSPHHLHWTPLAKTPLCRCTFSRLWLKGAEHKPLENGDHILQALADAADAEEEATVQAHSLQALVERPLIDKR